MAVKREEKTYGEGDTFLVTNLLPEDVANAAFEALKNEVQWQTMYHHGLWQSFSIFILMIQCYCAGGEVPRLVAVQGQIHENGR